MSANTPQAVAEAVQQQLSVISKANGYATDIGTTIQLFDGQRPGSQFPSIAIGVRSGNLQRAAETGPDGRRVSPKARALDLVIEAAVPASALTAQAQGLAMLEDIERAWAVQTGLAPTGVSNVKLGTWQILDRPDGIEAVVLQIIGSADYIRTA